MAVYVSNIVIEQGFDFETTFQLEDTRTNSFLDLTTAIPEAQIRKHSGSSTSVSLASTISDGELGLLTVSLGSTATAALKPGRYLYDIRLTSGGKYYKAVEGTVLVRAGVTR